MTWESVSSSFYATPEVLAGSVVSGGIYILTPGVLVSESKSKSTSTSKYTTPGV